MNEYTDAEYRELLVARTFGARYALARLQEHMEGLAETAGDAWATDPRYAGLVEAVAVLGNYGNDLLLSDEDKGRVAKLTEMDEATS